MIRAAGFALLLALPLPALADVVDAKGGTLRLLDRMTGAVTDHDMADGTQVTEGRLTVRLDACRYPSDRPVEAYAHLTILDSAQAEPIFKGWMVASSPALNALDHPRYDVWVLHCDVPAADNAPAAPDSTNSGSGSSG